MININKDSVIHNFFYLCIPVYNCRDYLSIALNNIISQTYKEFCVVLVDDGSTDGSSDICESFSAIDSRIEVIHQENKGPLEARLTAINYIKTFKQNKANDYVLFLDSDDILLKSALSEINDILSQNRYDVVIYNYAVFSDKRITSASTFLNNANCEVNKLFILESIANNEVVGLQLWNKVFRFDVVKELESLHMFSGVRENEDGLQLLEIIRNSSTFYLLERILYFYRVNLKSISHSNKLEDYVKYRCIYWENVSNFLQNECMLLNLDYDRNQIKKSFLSSTTFQILLLLNRIRLSPNSVSDKIDLVKDLLTNRFISLNIIPEKKSLDHIQNEYSWKRIKRFFLFNSLYIKLYQGILKIKKFGFWGSVKQIWVKLKFFLSNAEKVIDRGTINF